jgi:hypothetical protein
VIIGVPSNSNTGVFINIDTNVPIFGNCLTWGKWRLEETTAGSRCVRSPHCEDSSREMACWQCSEGERENGPAGGSGEGSATSL